MAGGTFTAKQRAVVFERARHRCEICGCTLRLGWNCHHRQNRGMGGTRIRPTLAAAMALCGSGTTGCHGEVTNKPAWAEERGYVVRRCFNPAEIPVLIRGTWKLLDEAGEYVTVEQDDYPELPELVKAWGE